MDKVISELQKTAESGALEDYLFLITTAALCIYCGSKKANKLKEEKSTEVEKMKTKDALKFPIVGSAVLFTIFLVVKYIRKDLINVLVSIYFALFGGICVGSSVRPLFDAIFGKKTGSKKIVLFSENFVTFEISELLGMLLIGFPVSIFWAITKNWIANNVLGIAFAIEAISYVNLGSYKTGAILLVGLFAYDIFWVFGTPVMVSVVKGFNAPIKILYPRSGIATALFMGTEVSAQHSVLGLGDIAIPGFFVALLLRFDPSSKKYFRAGLAAYVCGLVNTMVVMHVFNAAQPALLYLVPWCLGSSFLVALCDGRLVELFNYDEETEEENNTDNVDKKKKENNNNNMNVSEENDNNKKKVEKPKEIAQKKQQQKKQNKKTKTN